MQFTLYLKELKEIFGVWWQGFLDALQFPSVYRVLKRDSLLRTLVYQCFLLNGVIFVGSNLLFTKGIQPLTNYFFKFDETLDPSLQSLIWLFQQFYWIAHLVKYNQLFLLTMKGLQIYSLFFCVLFLLDSLAVPCVWNQLHTQWNLV
jgi:hypothetical protein